ncbi:MAG: AAA family ATPase, partial [Tunicatimonas sp.]
LYIGIGGGEEYPIYNLGDGIQSVVILTYPLFFNQGQELLFFIEEPEHGLHPSMQRIFLETLMREEFSSFQYFLTTHSNHLLDITLDIEHISIYTFRKDINRTDDAHFLIENVDNEHINTLELIGVRNSSVFLSNCTIWVEGITDRIYIRKYLDVYQKDEKVKFKEDLHYSFVEYAGGNITHWSFLEDADADHPNIEVERLCGKLFLITDKDGAGLKKDGAPNPNRSKKQQRHEKLKRNLDDRYHRLDCREIENTLSPEVLKKVIQDYEKDNATLDFEKLKYESYKNEYLGSFIERNVDSASRSYKSESGTIKDKVNFAKKAVTHIESVKDLSKEARDLTEKLYNFIEGNNKQSVAR